MEMMKKAKTLTGLMRSIRKVIPSLVSRWIEPIAINNMAKAILSGKAVQAAGHRMLRPNLNGDIVSRPVMYPRPSA